MSTDTVSQTSPPVKGDIVLTRKGHRRLWDGRHWRVLCRVPDCQAQRQGSLHNKFGLCKKHFSQMSFVNSESSSSPPPPKIEQEQTLALEEDQQTTKKICKRHRHNLDLIVDRLRRSQATSSSSFSCIE